MKNLWRVMLAGLLLCPALATPSVQLTESEFILHNGGRLTFTHPSELFNRVGITVLNTGNVVVSNPSTTLQPNVTYLRLAGAADLAMDGLTDRMVAVEGDIVRLERLISELPTAGAPDTAAVAEVTAAVDTVRDQVTALGTTVNGLQDQVSTLFDGFPLTEMNSDEAKQLTTNYNLLVNRFEQMERTVTEALNDLPIIAAVAETTPLAALTPYITSNELTRGGSAVGAQLTRTVSLPHDAVIQVGTAATTKHIMLNGNNEAIVLAAGSRPQLHIGAGSTLELENITLRNIHANSILIEPGGTIILGQNVAWEIHEDLYFAAGSITLNGTDDVIRWRGMSGGRTVTLAPMTVDGPGARINVGSNALALHGISLFGGQQISVAEPVTTTQGTHVGCVGLCGNAQLAARGDLNVGVLAAGRNNELVMEKSGCRITAPVMFCPVGANELALTVRHSATEAAVCGFEQGALFVASEHGTACLKVRNPHVMWQCVASGSCVVGAHGSIDARSIYVSGNPIVDATDTVALSQTTVLTSGRDNSITHTIPADYNQQVYTALHHVNGELSMPRLVSDQIAIYHNQVQLNAMRDTVIIDGGTVTDWQTDATAPAHIILRNGARLEQANEATTVKADDTITVYGKGNRLVLNNDLEFAGKIVCKKKSELTIECGNGTHLTFAPANPDALHLDDNAQLIIQGAGSVRVASDLHCLGSEFARAPASLCVQDGTILTVASGATFKQSGHLNFMFDTYALCVVEPGAQLLTGMNAADNIAVLLDRNSGVLLGHDASGSATGQGRWSITHATYSLLAQRGGTVQILDAGSMELNMRDGVAVPGMCQELRFMSGGGVHVSGSGMLSINDNKLKAGVRPPLVLHEHGGGIYGDGLVGSSTMTEYGRCQKPTLVMGSRIVSGTAREIIAPLINLINGLKSALYFVNSEGAAYVHTAQVHALVALNAGEYITHDDATSGMVYGTDALGNSFSIRRNGTRA